MAFFNCKPALLRGAAVALPLTFMLLLVATLASSHSQKPRVLLLHSYYPDYQWVRDLNIGWQRRFDGHAKANVKVHYLDTKRFPSASSKAKAAQQALHLIGSWKPDVVVAIDDDAQALVGKRLLNQPGLSLIYAGVQNTPASYNYTTAHNVSGISEAINLTAVRDALSVPHQHNQPTVPLRIAHLSDQSTYSGSVSAAIRRFDWSPHRLVSSQQLSSFENWQQAVLQANRQADVLLITNYHTLLNAKRSSSVPSRHVLQWTLRHSPLPMLGTWGFFVDDGGMLALAVSPFEQGETAATLALAALSGEVIPPDRRHLINHEMLVMLRASELRRRGWQLPEIYRSYARATGNARP